MSTNTNDGEGWSTMDGKLSFQRKAEDNEIPEGTLCWICHEEDGVLPSLFPEGSTQSLTRDCACRGTSGYAHWCCLVQFAMNKIQEGGDITRAFRECPMCNSSYQGDHRLAIADAFVQFAEGMGDRIDPFRYGEALWVKMLALDDRPAESKETCRKMISVLEQIDGKDGAKNLMSLAYEKLGWQAAKEGVRMQDDEKKSSEKFKEAIKYYEKYQNLARACGNTNHVNDATTKIARTKRMDPLSGEVKQDLVALRKVYQKDKSEVNCSNLVLALRIEGHEIELERLMANHLTMNRRVLGHDHPTTMEQEYGLKGMSVRRLEFEGKDHRFVGYEEDGAKCVIAPMKSSHDFPGGNDFEEGKEFTIEINDMHEKAELGRGTPVKCIGLKGAAHLNGQLGDARKYDKETKRYIVHFEGTNVKPRSAKVKMSNLEIVLDLPALA